MVLVTQAGVGKSWTEGEFLDLREQLSYAQYLNDFILNLFFRFHRCVLFTSFPLMLQFLLCSIPIPFQIHSLLFFIIDSQHAHTCIYMCICSGYTI